MARKLFYVQDIYGTVSGQDITADVAIKYLEQSRFQSFAYDDDENEYDENQLAVVMEQEKPRLHTGTIAKTVGGSIVVRFRDQHGQRIPSADYEATDRIDALNTINHSLGRSDRMHGLPCRSADGSYLDGWYSVDKLSDTPHLDSHDN